MHLLHYTGQCSFMFERMSCITVACKACGRPLKFNYLHPAWLTFNYSCILGDMYTTWHPGGYVVQDDSALQNIIAIKMFWSSRRRATVHVTEKFTLHTRVTFMSTDQYTVARTGFVLSIIQAINCLSHGRSKNHVRSGVAKRSANCAYIPAKLSLLEVWCAGVISIPWSSSWAVPGSFPMSYRNGQNESSVGSETGRTIRSK